MAKHVRSSRARGSAALRKPTAVATSTPTQVVWGVDSARAANSCAVDGTLAYDSVARRAGAPPTFWGRYIVGDYVLTSSEAAYIQSQGCKILLVSNGPQDTSDSVQGGTGAGRADGNAAVKAARTLCVPAGVALYADIEGSWAVTADWLCGWATAVTRANYLSGFYGDCTPGSSFDQAYCAAQAEPKVAASLLWSMQPEPDPQCQVGGSAPAYAPATTSCGGRVVLWQYTEDCWQDTLGTDAGIDMDLGTNAALASMW